MKRKNILQAAARLFSERGFNNTSTLLLAQEAGVAEGTIFRHFKTKDEIFCELIQNIIEQLVHTLKSVLEAKEGATGLDRTLTLCREFCIFLRRNPMEFGILFRDATNRYGNEADPAFRATRSLYREISHLLLQALTAGQEDGTVDPALKTKETSEIIVCHLIGYARGVHFNLIGEDGQDSKLLGVFLDNTAKLCGNPANFSLRQT